MKVFTLVVVGSLFLGCQSFDIKEEKQKSKSVVKTKNPSVNIKPNQKINSPLYVEFTSDGLWFANEGELGTVSLVDADNNTLGTAILRVTDGNWMSKESVTSKVPLTFQTRNSTSANLIFKNNNPSMTEGENKEFEIAVILEKEKMPDLLVGDWYQIEPKRALKAFTLRGDLTAKSITMATLLYKSYKRVGKDKIVFSIQSLGNGSSSTDDYTYFIEYLDDDKMILREIYKGKKNKVKEVYTKSHPL